MREVERNSLRSFYATLREVSELEHSLAIRTLLARVLVSPALIYRAEKSDSQSIGPLSNWELASRLSYFLWSSVPDMELRQAASDGVLRDPNTLVAHAQRMLCDGKSQRFATEFFGQWFGFYQFDHYHGVDPEQFPEFTEELRNAMHEEAVTFFEHIVRNDRPISEILLADYAFLNRELAGHYGADESLVSRLDELGPLQQVGGAGSFQRGGLLGLGAVLTATSAPLRTSPVKRGDWILRKVLGTPVPPPPADAGSIPADDSVSDDLTIRQRLAAHRRDESCMNCHSRIDPLGFALENYDALGRWRDRYSNGQAIDATSELADGSRLSGAFGQLGLRQYLIDNRESFYRTFCVKLLGYALGRRELLTDAGLIEEMMADTQEDGRLSSLVAKLVVSPQFRFHRGASDDVGQDDPD